MTRIAVALLFLAISGPAFAQPHRLAFYADRNATSCDLEAGTSGFLGVHVVLEGSGLISAVEFRAMKPACMSSATWLTDAWDTGGKIVLGGIGNTQHDVGVAVFFDCHASPIYVGRVLYLLNGPIDPCCLYEATPYIGQNPPYTIGVYRANLCPVPTVFHFESASAKGVVINPDPTCMCSLPVSVQQSTWGAVKALYR